MSRYHVRAAWFVLGAFLALPVIAQPRSIDRELAEAEKLRSADGVRFQALLVELRKRIDRPHSCASELQRQRLQYLTAYEVSVYGNDRPRGIELAAQVSAQTHDVNLKFRTTALAANLAAIERRFSLALSQLDQAMALLDQVTDEDTRRKGISATAIIYNQMGAYDLGLRYAQQLLDMSPNGRDRCFAQSLKIAALLHLREQKADTRDAEAAIEVCIGANEPIITNLTRAELAERWSKDGRAEDAIDLLTRSFPEAEATRYPALIAQFHSLLGDFLLERGKYDEAAEHAHHTLALLDADVGMAPQVRAWQTLYRVAEARGQTIEARELYRHFSDARLAYERDTEEKLLALASWRNRPGD